MTYARGRRMVDADSHLMEWPSFLTEHASAGVAARLPKLPVDVGPWADRSSRRSREELVALGDELLRKGPKWSDALGAVDPAERSTALDLLGFERQVVYSSLCARLFDLTDPELRYAAYRAHNRAMAAFCAQDRRLSGVALCDLDGAEHSLAELDAALDLGLGQIWIPARAPAGRSPGHPAHDAFWARLAERGVPFVLHVGSGAFSVGDAWMDDGRNAPVEVGTRPEVIGSKDLMVIYQPIERFLSVLVLDGVLERHRSLRGGAIEMGAGWVPDMLRRLDHAVAIWSKSEPDLARFERTPSEQATAQLRFTPYPFEDVGLLCRESDPSLYMFSSDYPHAEGGRDPVARFDRSLRGHSAEVLAGFYAGNAAAWLAPAEPPA
ncbi:MAG: amidohydrolase family protein [Myxococcota bacterium]